MANKTMHHLVIEDNNYEIVDQKARQMVASEYDETATYHIGDLVVYDGKLLRCTAEIATPEAYNLNHWTYFTVKDALDNLEQGNVYASCNTAENDLNKTAQIFNYDRPNYAPKWFGIVAIRFVNAVKANSTLNINNTGAKPIYKGTSPITDGVIKAGDTALFMLNGSGRFVFLGSDTYGDKIDSLIEVSETQPQSENNKLWITESALHEYTIPTNEEFLELKADTTTLKEDISDITEESTNLGYVTTFDGTKTISNVTIARKNANTLTVYGTADGWGKFDVLRGNNNMTAGTPTLSANLDAGTYTLVCNAVFNVLVGVDYSSSVVWASGTSKTFDTDVCVWLRVTSSSRNYGTVDNPSEFNFAIYIGETDTTEIVPTGLIGIDSVARKSIENIDAELDSADIDSVVNAKIDTSRPYNIIPPDTTWYQDSLINFATGAIQSSSGRVASDYIEIDPSYEYLCNYVNVRIIGDPNITDGNMGVFTRTAMAFYDKDKNFVQTTSTSTDASKAIPSNAKYVRLTLDDSKFIPYAIAFYGNYSTVQNVRYTPYRKQPKQPQFYGYTGYESLEMVMFGDSITHGDLGISNDGISYVDYANDFLRGNIVNVGLGGSRLSQGDPTGIGLGSFASLCENIVSDDATAWNALDAYAAVSDPSWIPHINKLKAVDWDKTQAIGLLYGANDWNNNVPIGTETNNDPTKYDGACVYGLNLLLTKYPHLQVILFTPFYRKIDATRDADTPNTAGHTIFDYGKSLQDNVRPVFHCPVVDSGNEVGINRYNIYVYTQLVDGTHPRTNIAQYRLGRYFAESIKRHIQPF